MTERGDILTESCDAILIGAGINTLVAAAHLSARGWSVRVLERGAEPGGAVRTGAYTIPGFRHDWAAMNLSLFAGSGFFRAYSADLTRLGLSFVPAPHAFASVFSDGSWCGVSADPAVTRARIAALSPADAATWDRLLADFPAMAPHLFALLSSPMKFRALSRIGWGLWRAKGVGGTLDLVRFLLSSPRRWLSETFTDPRLHAMLGAWGMHLDFAPDISGGAVFPYLESMATQSFGMVIGKGGADTVTRALVAFIEERGGKVDCNAEVAGVVTEGGTARGVKLTDGRQITARRAVIAGVSPSGLARLTGATGEERFDRGLAGFDHAPGTMMIHLALSAPLDWAAGAELQQFAYVHLAPDLEQMARTYQEARAGLLPDRPVIVVGQPTALDPSRAPDGKHTLWLQVRMAPGTIRGDAGGTITATDWAQAADPFAKRALSILEAAAPGTRAKILGRRIVTPADLEADNPNLVGGDQICGSHHLAQHFLFRPMRGRADGSTPVKNLYLTGAAVWPGAGTGAGAGWLLAQSLTR